MSSRNPGLKVTAQALPSDHARGPVFDAQKVAQSSSSLLKFILKETPAIYREAQGFLKHPFFVPGGLFHDELWDWDSFWIIEGIAPILENLDVSARDAFFSHAKGSWMNFFEHQAPNGSVPIMLKARGGDFFGCTDDAGNEKNQAKPVFAQMARTISRFSDGCDWIRPYYGNLKRFCQRWRSKYGNSCGLLVWGSDVAIGADNDPTTYGRPEFSSANLLLNCLFHQELEAMREIASALGYEGDVNTWEQEISRLDSALQSECWDEIDGFFYTVDVLCADVRHLHFPQLKRGMEMSWKTVPQKIKMFTGFLPLWCGVATERQARILVEHYLLNSDEFDSPHGLRSLSRREKMYDPSTDSANPSNWLGPIWVVSNYMAYVGLKRYGYHVEASALASKIIVLLGEDVEKHGVLHECYNPETGKPNFNAGFLSWNVLVGAMIAHEATEIPFRQEMTFSKRPA